MDKRLEFILVPKCPLFGDSTVVKNLGVTEFVNISTRKNFQFYGSDFFQYYTPGCTVGEEEGGGGDLVVAFCKI